MIIQLLFASCRASPRFAWHFRDSAAFQYHVRDPRRPVK